MRTPDKVIQSIVNTHIGKGTRSGSMGSSSNFGVFRQLPSFPGISLAPPPPRDGKKREQSFGGEQLSGFPESEQV